MPDENLAESAPPAPRSSFRLPAEYYAAPPERPVFPRWVAFGCGGAALLALIVIFLFGAFFTTLMQFSIDGTMAEVRKEYASDVTDAQKKRLDAEMETLTRRLDRRDAKLAGLDKLLSELMAVREDRLVRADEVERLTKLAHEMNAPAAAKPARMAPQR